MTVAQLDVALDRPLPQSPDAERAVLGSILINNACWHRINLTDRDFFRDAHRTIYRAMARLAEERKEIDLLTLREELQASGELEQVGGTAYIASLVDGIPDIANVERYAHIVAEKAKLRSVIIIANETMRAALDAPDESAAELSSRMAAKLTESTSGAIRESKPMYDVVTDIVAQRAYRAKEGRSREIKTGVFPALDFEMVIRRQAMTIFSAPSSHGKSTIMLNATIGAVRNATDLRALFCSLEMNDEDVTDPVKSMMSGVLLTRIQRGTTNEMDDFNIRAALNELSAWKNHDRLHFSQNIRDVDGIHREAMRRKLRHGLDLVVVDHIQLVRGYDERNREQDLDRIGRNLRYMGQDLNVAVVVGSQVNKERERRSSGRLSNSDHKGGAVIGEHADVVCMLQRPRQDDKANREIPWCQVHFQVEKNRGHETGDVPMHADMPTQTFSEGDCEQNNCRTLRGGPLQQKLNA